MPFILWSSSFLLNFIFLLLLSCIYSLIDLFLFHSIFEHKLRISLYKICSTWIKFYKINDRKMDEEKDSCNFCCWLFFSWQIIRIFLFCANNFSGCTCQKVFNVVLIFFLFQESLMYLIKVDEFSLKLHPDINVGLYSWNIRKWVFFAIFKFIFNIFIHSKHWRSFINLKTSKFLALLK